MYAATMTVVNLPLNVLDGGKKRLKYLYLFLIDNAPLEANRCNFIRVLEICIIRDKKGINIQASPRTFRYSIFCRIIVLVSLFLRSRKSYVQS